MNHGYPDRCQVSIHLAVFAIDLAEFDVSRVALLRFVRVTGVHLLQVHRAVVDEEPDAGGALDRRFGFRIVAARSCHPLRALVVAKRISVKSRDVVYEIVV